MSRLPASVDDRIGSLYRRFPAALVARRNVSRNRLRSALAVLGIVIGVVAIASLGLAGTTLQTAFTSSFAGIGDQLVVNPAFDEGVTELTERDVERIERVATDAAVVPVRSKRAVVSVGRDQTVVTAYAASGVGAVYPSAEGRIPDRLRRGAVVGSGVADRFDIEPGNSLSVDGDSYRVVAVLESQGGGFDPLGVDQAVFLPNDAVDGDGYGQVIVKAESGTAANETAVAIRAELNEREPRVSVFELSSIVDQITSFLSVIRTFLVAIGGISLVVAGVSILNVMLMSTVERREEIGVFRAVGVYKRDVMAIILVEAAMLGLVGGLVGAAVSAGVGVALASFALGDPLAAFTVTNLLYLALAVVFGVVTSLLSGLYPAWKAANERPVEALRD
ncbi:ABC transporter permease [Halobaculum marinum]|uniref:ABC transporter permease n=1 Tax=Halobaculum marinum TaxID=3031996 RepID=A0ABD5X0E2_9EURY|nr:ABC transporter permease [Halobaculum sp. DT55]